MRPRLHADRMPRKSTHGVPEGARGAGPTGLHRRRWKRKITVPRFVGTIEQVTSFLHADAR